ncbi:MAG: PDZ domain-containing protein [Woeseiaceae bacterium]|nr:PDZ domain-containing protein [Woeseiaceae bacterium]
MVKHPLIVVLGLLTGVAVGATGALMLADSADEPTSAAGSVADYKQELDALAKNDEIDPERLVQIVDSLARLIDEEIAERDALAEQIVRLEAEVAQLRAAFISDNSGSSGFTGPGVVTDSPPQPEPVRETREDRLLAAGFPPARVEEIERVAASSVMERVELDDRARREGWVDTERYVEAVQDLPNPASTVRDYLGDADYDRYLYANGSPNRVGIQSVIGTSPAEAAGLQAGDTIVSYGGQRVFTTEQLLELRSSGESGQPVAVEVMRNGQIVQVSMPRGPIGITTMPSRRDPDRGS